MRLGTLLRRSVVAAALALSAAVPHRAAAQAQARPLTFAVLGHIRGDRDRKLYEYLPMLLRDVRAARPDAVVLTGDIIWGEFDTKPVDRAVITRMWDEVDSALATLGVPVYRVPGNHDISDPVTRDVYFARYGRPPQAVTLGRSRLLLLNSAVTPAGADTTLDKRPVRGAPLDSAQRAFLAAQLADTGAFDHAFVFTHHLLWFEDDAPWWAAVHPLLEGRKVRAVFSGDLGPMKFAHLSRDSVEYFQSTMEGNASVGIQRALLGSRLIGAQFDNWLLVSVRGNSVSVDVRVFGAAESGKFTPQRWAEVNREAEPEPVVTRVWNLVGSPVRLAVLAFAAAVLVGVGFVLGRGVRGRA